MKLLTTASIIPTVGLLTKVLVYAVPLNLDSEELPVSLDHRQGRGLKGNLPSPFTTRDELKAEVDKYCGSPLTYTSVYGPIESWDVSQVTSFRQLFISKACNPDVSAWDTSRLTNLNAFSQDSTFNADISCWNTTSLTTMRDAFWNNKAFNQNIGNWDVSKVTTFDCAFNHASNFNQNLGCWPSTFWNASPGCRTGFNGGTQGQPCVSVGNCNTAGGGGDPHFHAFGNNFFTWQGWCDTILLKTPQLSDAPEIQMNIRSRRVRKWSAIDTVAVKVDSYIAEVGSHDGNLLLNGKEVDGIASPSVPFSVTVSTSATSKHTTLYYFDFGNSKRLEVKVDGRRNMLYTTVSGDYPPGTVGILGSPHRQGLFMRNGTKMKTGDINTYVESWQVRDTDEQIFKQISEPQYPQKCAYYTSEPTSQSSRHLKEIPDVSFGAASNACEGHHPGPMRNWCIDDVILTGDLESAQESFYG